MSSKAIAVWLSILGLSPMDCFTGANESANSASYKDENPNKNSQGPTTFRFDLNVNLKIRRNFYTLPYPSDLRLDGNNQVDLSGFPMPLDSHERLKGMVKLLAQKRGFSVISAAYFEADGALPKLDAQTLIPASKESPVLLLDVDPQSAHRGTLYPTVADDFTDESVYLNNPTLAVAPYPGIVLRPKTRYAYVVKRSLKGAHGKELGVSPFFASLVKGEKPQARYGPAAYKLYQPLFETLDQLGISRDSLAVATVFTTGDVVAETAALSTKVVDNIDVEIDNLKLYTKQSATFCSFQGSVQMPQFQKGKPPFDSAGDFEFDAEGMPVIQRYEKVPVIVNLPRSPMPTHGYPYLLYLHGSNGLSTQVNDRGPQAQKGGPFQPLLGPAHVMAGRKFASIGVALPLNPERGCKRKRCYLNLDNPAAYPFTFLQGTIELRLLIEALNRIAIPKELAASCLGSTAIQASHVRFAQNKAFILGQSHGSAYAYMLGAVDPMVRGVALTGAGGFWSLLLQELYGSLFGTIYLQTAFAKNHLHPGLRLIQTAWEAAEPLVYAPRIAVNPLPGHPLRSIYQPVGENDSDFPESIFDAMALALGNEQAGKAVWSSMADSLQLGELKTNLAFPLSLNKKSPTQKTYTGVVVQFADDHVFESHYIFNQREEVKYQYSCFFLSLFQKGVAVISPLTPDKPCALP